MLDVLRRLPGYWLLRRFNMTSTAPLALAISVTHKCNSRCKTCNLHLHTQKELSLREYEKIFKSMKRKPRWVTITGGEPFIRNDIYDIISAIAVNIRPDAITIATNGSLTGKVEKLVNTVVKDFPKIKFIINISIDGIGQRHDEIRGMEGAFERAITTFGKIREMPPPRNVRLGINTVVSKYNSAAIPELIEYVSGLGPDSHLIEPAQPRVELGVRTKSIEPSLDEYGKIVAGLVTGNLHIRDEDSLGEIIAAFRKRYYQLSYDILMRREQVVPCFAAVASAHIGPDGVVWSCCTIAKPLGYLRDANYDFRRVWKSRDAAAARRYIREGRCFCAMANASYVNLLVHPPAFWSIVRSSQILRKLAGGRRQRK